MELVWRTVGSRWRRGAGVVAPKNELSRLARFFPRPLGGLADQVACEFDARRVDKFDGRVRYIQGGRKVVACGAGLRADDGGAASEQGVVERALSRIGGAGEDHSRSVDGKRTRMDALVE